MKLFNVMVLLNLLSVLSVFGAASDQPIVPYITLPKTGTIENALLDQPTLPLSVAAGIALIDEAATAAKIELSDINPVILLSFIKKEAQGDLKKLLQTEKQRKAVNPSLYADIVTFIKRCGQGIAAVSPDQKREIYFRECNEWRCPASRIRNPSVRPKFEQMIASAIVPRYVETYCSFASGDLLQDVRLLEQWKEQGKKITTIVLIDPEYLPLTSSITKNDRSGFYFTLDQSLHVMADYAKHINVDSYPKELTSMARAAKTIQEFATRIAALYPESFKGIYVYPDTEAYVADCKKFPERRADVLVACDIKHMDLSMISPKFAKAWHDYHLIEGNALQVSAVSALLSISGGMLQNRVFMRVKGTTGMASKYAVFDDKGLREITQQEHDELTQQEEKIMNRIGKERTFVLAN